MDAWFEVDKKDVICVEKRRKTGRPWGDHPDETYAYLVFRDEGRILMVVNAFHDRGGIYSCCRFYTEFLGNSEEEFRKLSEQDLAAKAYNAWCSGAR